MVVYTQTLTRLPDYISLVSELSSFSIPLDYLFPHIAFITLNYPFTKTVDERKNYFVIANRIIKLINSVREWENPPDIQLALSNPKKVIDSLCSRAKIDNPFENIEQTLKFLETEEGKFWLKLSPEINLCKLAIEETLNHFHRFLFWPMAPTLFNTTLSQGMIGPSSPIWNVIYSDNDKSERIAHNVTQMKPEFFSGMERSVHKRSVVDNIIYGIKYDDDKSSYAGLNCPFLITRDLCPNGLENKCKKKFRFDKKENPPKLCAFSDVLIQDFGMEFCSMIDFPVVVKTNNNK